MMPLCTIHRKEAVWRDKDGYYYCPKCLEETFENHEKCKEKVAELRVEIKKWKEAVKFDVD